MAIWQALWSAGKISPLFISGPSAIASDSGKICYTATFLSDIAYSGKNFAIGFVLAVIAGVVLGVIIGWYKRIEMITAIRSLNALYATPRVAMVPLIIIWFGIGMWSKVFIVFISAFFPILINTIGGIQRDRPRSAAKRREPYCATDCQIFTTSRFPARCRSSSPASARAWRWDLIGVVVGEMFGGSQGIGFMVAYGGQTFATDTLFVGVMIIAFSGIMLTWIAERWKDASPAGVPSAKASMRRICNAVHADLGFLRRIRRSR